MPTSYLPEQGMRIPAALVGFLVAGAAAAAPTITGPQDLAVPQPLFRIEGLTPGADVVQLYTHQRAGSTSRPVRELKAFRKVTVPAHGSEKVEFTLPAEELSYWSPALGKRVLEPGTFDLWIGDSSRASLHCTFEVSAP